MLLQQIEKLFGEIVAMESSNNASTTKVITGDAGYVLEDVPHLTDYIQGLPTYPNQLQTNPAYSVVKQYFVNVDDSVAQKIVCHKNSPRGTHFRRAGPRQKVYFESDEVHACIVTCGGLCPGLNTVIREIVCGLSHMYGVTRILGIDGGYKGFYSRNTIPLNPKVVNDIHKRGGTVLGTSRGGHDTSKIVDSIQDRGINQVYIIGGDGTQKGASVIFEEIRRRGLKVAVAGIPKTIDNDIPVIDKSFGFDTAVEEAQRAINAAHVESESIENGIGMVKLMGRYSGFIAMYATLASRDVDCCLIPESPFYLEGKGGLFEFIERRLKENGHMVIVMAEGAGQELLSESLLSMGQDASGNNLLQDVGLWMSHRIKVSLMLHVIAFLFLIAHTLFISIHICSSGLKLSAFFMVIFQNLVILEISWSVQCCIKPISQLSLWCFFSLLIKLLLWMFTDVAVPFLLHRRSNKK